MNLLDLMPFCATKTQAKRVKLWEPWSDGDFTFASDARVIIKVPRLAEVPERADAPKNTAKNLFEAMPPVGGWFTLPELPPALTEPCERCKGTAIAFVVCEKCDGTGKEMCETCGQDHDCPKCKGKGGMPDAATPPQPCPHCTEGQALKTQLVKCGDNTYNAIFLQRIAQLPGVRVAETHTDLTQCGPLAFEFNGGEGRLMPVRV